jgi:hypothetical protein
MKLPNWGAFILAGCLSGCFAPVAQREAQQIAIKETTRYCHAACGPLQLGRTQKIKGRWLVDLDGPRQKFTVTVETDGNYKVDAWDKTLSPAATP